MYFIIDLAVSDSVNEPTLSNKNGYIEVVTLFEPCEPKEFKDKNEAIEYAKTEEGFSVICSETRKVIHYGSVTIQFPYVSCDDCREPIKNDGKDLCNDCYEKDKRDKASYLEQALVKLQNEV